LSCAIGARQLHRQLDGYTYRPRMPRALAGILLRTGLPNHALTLVERSPNLLLPAIVTEVLSPELNAYWYIAWMMAWAVLVIPVSVGLTLFAQVAKDPAAVASGVRKAGQTGAALGIVSAAGAALIGPLVLGLLGREYADNGTTPVRVLVLGVLPVLAIQMYYAVCRSRSRVREAVAAGAVTAVASIVATALAAQTSGLAGMAWAWVAVQAVSAVWAAIRLRVLLRRPAVSAAAAPVDPLSPPAG
jgi:O-antigen/teichoic acid export membrane protein